MMNKYARVRQIGEGAFGKAILVKRKDSSVQCVIKEINTTKMSPKEREESRKEVAVLAQLNHPNIVTYIESFEEKGTLYIVMNFCSGGDLYSKINDRRGQLFSEDQILNWFVQLCLAIKHIHDRKILHRDIKSQNIFLTSSGKVQLGDFGIAKVLNSTVQLAHTCIGTPYYLSPEIVENMPYNNKSDVWSMGCVLYELTTLKHAFEAGNMKNLVLKIIRGNYPPVSPQFSYDLRGLIAQLFKRNPRDRPNVNAILRKNFVMQRVRKLLSEQDLQNEFSHTVMHGHKIAKALPPAPKPSADPSRKAAPSGGSRPGSANKRYDPAAVYGAPLNSARRSAEQKKRPSTPGGGRPVPVPGQADWEKKRKERQEIELRRRAEMRKREQEMNERRHKDLQEKQKVARINKAREEGWRALVDSPVPLVNENDNRPVTPKENARPLPVPRGQVDNRDRGNYEAYNDFIDKLQRDRQGQQPPAPADRQNKNWNPNHVDVINVAAQRPAVPVRQQQPQQPQLRPPQPAQPPPPAAAPPRGQFQQNQQNYMGPLGVPGAFDQYGRDRQKGAQAVERARVVDDYLERQRIAALNKRRAQHDIYGNNIVRPSSADRRTPVPAPRRGPSPSNNNRDDGRKGGGGGGGGGMLGRNRDEQEYLEKLRQIRIQNAKDRRNVRGGAVAEAADHDRRTPDSEERKRKLEALKVQAEQWADMKKKELEKQRAGIVPVNRQPPVPMTEALNAIAGPDKVKEVPDIRNSSPKTPVPLTNALKDIGASTPEPRPKSALQKQREGLLKKLNAKGPSRGKWGSPANPAIKPKEEEGERGKWGAPGNATAVLAVEEGEGSESARSQWGQGKDLHLSQLSLEQTASHMDATTSLDLVVKAAGGEGGSVASDVATDDKTSARSHWGARNSGIVKAFDKMPICSDTMSLGEASSPVPPVGIGNTIVIAPGGQSGGSKGKQDDSSKVITPSSKDAELVSRAVKEEQKRASRPLPLPPERSSTIVISKGMTGNNLPYEIPTVTSPQPSDEHKHLEQPSEEGKKPEHQSTPSSLSIKTKVLESDTTQSPQSPQAALGETELPSSIRFVDTKNGSDESPSSDEQAKRILGTLVEVSESQSLSTAQQQSVHTQFKDYLASKKSSTRDNISEVSASQAIDDTDSAILTKTKVSKGQLSDKWSTLTDDTREGAKSVQMNLTSGNFDLRNVELLRTCSEPDLSNLFRTMVSESSTDDEIKGNTTLKNTLKLATIKRHKSLDLSAVDEDDDQDDDDQDDDDDDDDEFALPEGDDDDGNDAADDEDEEDDYNDDCDDDEDMKSMISTMQSILVEDEELATGDGPTKKKTNLARKKVNFKSVDTTINTRSMSKGKVGDSGDADAEDNNEEDDDDDDNDEDAQADMDDEDEEYEREKLELAAALELENDTDSDDETTFGDDDEGGPGATKDFDRFGRLEEMRMELESELGVEKLIEVYQAIQRIQEDDEGNMEDGAKMAVQLLGPAKQNLFPKIFQLVMSDSVFQEDNS